jgi:hypothetical protein
MFWWKLMEEFDESGWKIDVGDQSTLTVKGRSKRMRGIEGRWNCVGRVDSTNDEEFDGRESMKVDERVDGSGWKIDVGGNDILMVNGLMEENAREWEEDDHEFEG